MEFKIMDQDFNIVDIVDRFESAIWTIRAKEAGDFEIYAPVESSLLEMTTTAINNGWYLFCDKFYDADNEKANLMFIETIEITSDPEDGAKMRITGFDLKAILDRRIVIGQKTFETGTKVNEVMKELIRENITEPTDWHRTYQDSIYGNINIDILASDRIIDNFVVIEDGTDFPKLTGDLQYEGTSIYSIFTDIATNYKVSYDIEYNFKTGNFELRIFSYRDRSYDQTDYPPIIFSPGFENLKDSNYLESTSSEKTFGLIIGEGDEYNKMYNVIGGGSGLTRKELAISASDVSRTSEEGKYVKAYPDGTENPKALGWYEMIDDKYVKTEDTVVDSSKTYYIFATEFGNKTYLSMLYEKGQTEMSNNYSHIKTYEGTAETTRGYSYPEDFTIGDIVEIVNEWGISSKVLISEVIYSISTDAINVIPTFATIEENTPS